MKLKLDAESISKQFDNMLNRSSLVTGWLNRVGYPMLQDAQRVRWQTKGISEGVPWAKVTNKKYLDAKLKRFADYPGAGRKLLIATGRLAFSMSLTPSLTSEKSDAGDHYKLVQGNRLEMGSFVPYAKYVEENGRDITTLGADTRDKIVKNLTDYIMKGTMSLIK